MKILLVQGLLLITMFSCVEQRDGEQKNSLLSNFLSITDNEDKGVKEILEYYGGKCIYSTGASASSKKGMLSYFKLEISQSEIIELHADVASMPASNVAYLFYKNLKEEKNNYNEIRVVLKFNGGEKLQFKYPMEHLKLVADRMPTVENVVDLIKKKEFKKINTFLNDSSVIQYNKTELTTNLEKFNSRYGEVKEFIPYGFWIDEGDNEEKLLHISGIIIRDIQNHEFSADFNLDSPISELLFIGYEF